MDDSQYFDSNIERAVSIMTAFSQNNANKKDNIAVLSTMLPIMDPSLSKQLSPLIKAIHINKILQNYISLMKQNTHIKQSRKEILSSLHNELDPHGQKILELFVKFNEIKDLMEVI